MPHRLSRISLAEVSRATGALMRRGDPLPTEALHRPRLEDITECLFFSPGDGRIWLNDQRMVLMHTASLGTLRRELIDTLGIERARGLLTRAGYESGARDARLVRERWPEGDLVSIFMAGTKLHTLEGVVKVEPVEFEIDPARGHYHGEFLWHNATEDDEHIRAYGVGTEPACWMQTGYAMGYVTGLMGRLVVFRELECRSMGAAQCRVVGKVAEAWGDVSEDLRYLNAQDFLATRTHGSTPQAVLGSKALLKGAGDGGAESTDATGHDTAGGDMVGVSSAFKAACHMLTRVAPTKASVLFTGESGVGKEMFASTLHRISMRRDRPFVAVNCAAIPESLVESELFGVERGAFTGATVSRAGRFERADGGTLFLDEIGTLSLPSQGKLLRALQLGEIERVGGSRTIRLDVRVVAATNVDLREAVKAGRFREDLFYRLDVYPIHLPPLRERREDIPLLLSHFLHLYGATHGRRLAGYAPRAVKALMGYAFPGNIRELQNMVERGVISADEGGVIDLPHMLRKEQLGDATWLVVAASGGLSARTGASTQAPADQGEPGAADPSRANALGSPGAPAAAGSAGPSGAAGEAPPTLLDQLSRGQAALNLEALEQQLLREAVHRAGGNLAAAARLLGLSRAQLAYRLKQRQVRAGGAS